jgi:uroporphyrinogen decarboxylase
MRGLDQWFTDTLLQPEFCDALLDQTLKFWMDWFQGFLGEVGDLVDVIMIGDDLAGQTGPLFRPDFYRRVVKPRHKQLVQYIRSRTEAKIWYHTCGSCMGYLPDLLDNGIDIINPVQISAKSMSPLELKSQFGKQLVFWGGAIDAQHVLPSASPEVVREHVRRNLEIWKPGGGYVFNNVHNIQADVPPENVVAFYEAAYEFGFYD